MLEASCKALEQALVEMNIPLDERPTLTPDQALKGEKSKRSSSQSCLCCVRLPSFDPFKTYSRRVNEVSEDGSISSGSTLPGKFLEASEVLGRVLWRRN